VSAVMRMPVNVELTGAERELAALVGYMRNDANRACGVDDRRASDRNIDAQGVAAELAFARVANVYPDLTTNIRAGGVDCVLPSGLTVDVKSTERPDGNLIAAATKGGKGLAHVAVLVTGVMPMAGGWNDWTMAARFTVVGWAWMADLMHPDHVRQFRTPTYFVARPELHRSLDLTRWPDQGRIRPDISPSSARGPTPVFHSRGPDSPVPAAPMRRGHFPANQGPGRADGPGHPSRWRP